jgi:IS5 family transposase
VTGANRHDVSQLETVLDAVVVNRADPPIRRNKHLCADAGYTGAPALKVIEEHGYIPHVKGRGQEADELKRDPKKKARRWVVEVAHSWFNHLAAAIIAFRKIKLDKNIIYG